MRETLTGHGLTDDGRFWIAIHDASGSGSQNVVDVDIDHLQAVRDILNHVCRSVGIGDGAHVVPLSGGEDYQALVLKYREIRQRRDGGEATAPPAAGGGGDR